MKKCYIQILSSVMIILLFTSISFAEANYSYRLNSNKSRDILNNDEITISLSLEKNIDNQNYLMYAGQNEVIFSTKKVEVIDNSMDLNTGWEYQTQYEGDKTILKFIYLDMTTKGTNMTSKEDIAKFKIKIKDDSEDIEILSKNPILTDKNANKLLGVSSSKIILENKADYNIWNGQTQVVDVEPHKQWKINFSSEVDELTIDGRVYIEDSLTKERFSTLNELSSDKKTITLKHNKPFESGRLYTLYISKDIRQGGKKEISTLSNGIKMEFTVK